MRDPIYGFIPLTKMEMDIIDTPIFQRLRRVHQLALTKYVYPSAEHSRFVHSIGVMHCATLLYEGVLNHKDSKILDKPAGLKLKILRLAALLHDIGHLPFSHAAENELLPPGVSHEDISGFIIRNHPPIRDRIIQDRIDPNMVASLLTKTPASNLRVEHDIVSGNLDADRADYLLRDSRSCGVCYGEYDLARFLNMFAVMVGDDNHYDLAVGENDLWLAESLLIARYHYNVQVPFHRTRSGFDIALQQFFAATGKKLFEQADFTDFDIAEFMASDDYRVMEAAKASDNEWAEYILRGKHLTAIVDVTSHDKQGSSFFQEAREKLESKGFVENRDYFIQEQAVAILKGATDQLEKPENAAQIRPPFGSIRLICRDGLKSVDICDRSWIFRQFTEKPLRIFRIYAKFEKTQELSQAIDGRRES